MNKSEPAFHLFDPNHLFYIKYEEMTSGFGFCIGERSQIFTKNETMICGLKNIDMADDCLKYTFESPGYAVGEDTLILPCSTSVSRRRIVTETSMLVMSGSNYQSPNFNLLLISMMVLFICYLKR